MVEDDLFLQAEHQACPNLADTLEQHFDELVSDWADRVLALPGSHYQSRSHAEIADWNIETLEAAIASLRSGSFDALRRRIVDISSARLELGFEMREVIQAWLLLREVALPFIAALEPDSDGEGVCDIRSLDALLRQGTDLFVEHYGRFLLSSVRQVTGTLLRAQGLSGIRRIVAHEALRLTAAAGVAVLRDDGDGRLTVVGEAGERLPSVESVLDRILPDTGGTLPTGPRFDNELSTATDPAGEDLPVNSLLMAPLRVGNHELGALLLFNSPRGFTADDLRVMRIFSDQAAIALEYARLSEEHEQVALLEERQRLARELHDSVTQSLYALSLYAEVSDRMLAEGDLERARQSVSDVRETALAALREVRLFVYELRPHALKDDGLIETIRNRLGAVEERVGIATRLECEGVERLPENIESGLHGIIHEALNNILKHAAASSIAISLREGQGVLTVDIKDDGVGFDPDRGRRKGGLGLGGMEEWARELQASFELISETGGGTHIHVEVPLTEAPLTTERADND